MQLKGPIIRYMSDSIRQLGGDLSSHNIYCRRCTNRKAGGFDPEYGILICANEMKDQGHLEDTMAHEMVHAYDHLRFKVDWTNNLRHAACTEVTMASLCGCPILADVEGLMANRFEPVHSVENVDGLESSSDAVSGSLHSNTKSVFDEGLFCQ
jgi:hypothetical protein